MTESLINIIYDDKFKIFIKEAQDDCKNFMDHIYFLLKNHSVIADATIEKYQSNIRKYIIYNQNKINMDKTIILKEHQTNSYPNFFAIFMALLINIDECDNFDDIMNKIKKIKKPRNGTDLQTIHCACSHSCKCENLFEIDYIPLNRAFLIGCDCYIKNKLVSPEIGKEMKAEVRNIRKKRGERIKRLTLFLKTMINLSPKCKMKRMFSKWKNKINKCIECKCLISKKEFFKNCENVKCDCKNEKLQKLYCWKCANNKFNRARFI